MIEMIILITIKEKEKEDLMKRLIDTFDYWGYTYLYLENPSKVLLVNKYGFASFEFTESYYKDPKSGEEYGEMLVTLTATERQMPLLAQEVIKDLMYMGLHKNVTLYHINKEIE